MNLLTRKVPSGSAYSTALPLPRRLDPRHSRSCAATPHAATPRAAPPRATRGSASHRAASPVSTPTSDGARGMTVQTVRCARRLSSCARVDLRCKSMPAQPRLLRTKRTRTAYMTFISDRRAARRATPRGTVFSTMGQPKAQGQRSIQIDGLRVPCVSLQTPGDQHELVFRSWRQARAASDIIDCLRRSHRAALSLELLGISHTQTGLESRPAALS